MCCDHSRLSCTSLESLCGTSVDRNDEKRSRQLGPSLNLRHPSNAERPSDNSAQIDLLVSAFLPLEVPEFGERCEDHPSVLNGLSDDWRAKCLKLFEALLAITALKI
jgi:hypothetical protein